MPPFDPTVLLPGIGTAVLAIISGAGGSALLELYWKPRRDRRKAAALLLSEVLLNTDLALLQAHFREKFTRKIPGDVSFSHLAWDATTDLLRELPADLLKQILLLYVRYEQLNSYVQEYGKTLDELQAAQAANNAHRETMLKGHLNSIIDAFNTALDKVIETAKDPILPQLLKLSGIKEMKTEKLPRDYMADVEKLLEERAERIRALSVMDRPGSPSGKPKGG